MCYTNDFYQRLIAPKYVSKYVKEQVDSLLKNKDCYGIVGKVKDEVCGVVFWEERKVPEIIDIMVFPKKQNKGYGGALLNKVLILLKEKGYKKVHLGVFKSNSPALHLYKKVGFRIINRLKTMFKYGNLKNSNINSK